MKKAYVGYSLDSEVRSTSTSGGICQLISRQFICNGGIVSGVCFDSEFNVIRDFAYSIDDLNRINKSKYVQAEQRDSYINIKKLLSIGENILFIGTPCQVSGLKSFLGKEYRNLYCIDFVCQGVPSSKAWNIYKKEISDVDKLIEVDFKDKRKGWRNFTFHVLLDNGREINEPGRENEYMKAMINKLNSRPSCYKCAFRSLDRDSDITVADAWGTEKIARDLLDDKGTSSVMVNTLKGEMLIQSIESKAILKEVSIEDLWSDNISAWKQYLTPVERKVFYRNLEKFGFHRNMKVIERYHLMQKFLKKLKIGK